MTGNNSTTNRQPTADSFSCVLISIVVLAYNCEKFIMKALDSLINQDYPEKNYEIIITDDGSTDSTGKICDDYAAKYEFIHVTHTKNQGTSCARNVAIPQCNGEYITFCDADDFVSPQMISIVTRIVELQSDADLIAFKYTHELSSKGWAVYDVNAMNLSDFTFMSSEEFCIKVITDVKNFGGFTWNKIVRSEIAKSVPFDESTSVMDDQVWLVDLLCRHQNIRICCTDYVLYCYVLHPNYGQTRNIGRIFNTDGISWHVICVEKELAIKNLPVRIKEHLNNMLYFWAVSNLYQMGRRITDDARLKLKEYIRKHAGTFYFASELPLSQKLKALIKRILSILHIHKY